MNEAVTVVTAAAAAVGIVVVVGWMFCFSLSVSLCDRESEIMCKNIHMQLMIAIIRLNRGRGDGIQ